MMVYDYDKLKREYNKLYKQIDSDRTISNAMKVQQKIALRKQISHSLQGVGIGNGGFGIGASSPVYPNQQQVMDPLSEEIEEKTGKIRIQDLDIAKAADVVDKVLRTTIVPFLWGPPGIGKSTLVREICKKNEWKLIDLRLSLLNPVDLRGLPVVDKDNKQADWYPPAFLPKYDTEEKGVLFLDEINLAPLSVQAAAYQLILDKKVGEYRFPPHWRIIAAGNRETDKANVYKLSAPLANRFVHFNITANFNSWKDWARVEGVRDEIIDFLTLRPSVLLQMPNNADKAFPSPRSWAFTSELLNAFGYNEEDGVTPDLQHMIVGTIGQGNGKEFIAFLKSWKLKGASKMVKEFIKTGKFTMPKDTSTRYAFVMAVFDAYISEQITPVLYQTFFSKLSGEEKKTLEEFEKENGEKLRKKRAKAVGKPSMNKPMGFLRTDIRSRDTLISINGTALKIGHIIIFDNMGNIEMCEVTNIISITSGDYEVRRGNPRDWPTGSFVQVI